MDLIVDEYLNAKILLYDTEITKGQWKKKEMKQNEQQNQTIQLFYIYTSYKNRKLFKQLYWKCAILQQNTVRKLVFTQDKSSY